MKDKTTHTNNEFPNLENLKSENGFDTPGGYFNSLHNSIMKEVNQVASIEDKKTRKISFYKVFGYAASIMIILGLSTLLFTSNPETLDEYDYESIVLNYEEISVDDYMDEFSEVDLELDENLLFDELAMN